VFSFQLSEYNFKSRYSRRQCGNTDVQYMFSEATKHTKSTTKKCMLWKIPRHISKYIFKLVNFKHNKFLSHQAVSSLLNTQLLNMNDRTVQWWINMLKMLQHSHPIINIGNILMVCISLWYNKLESFPLDTGSLL